MRIEGANNPGNHVYIDGKGRIEAHAISSTEQDEAALDGETFNLNTGTLTFTTDAETPLFYLKNEGEERALKISRVFMSVMASTGGTGPILAKIYKNPTGGTLLGGTDLSLTNYNFGSGKTIDVISKIGGTGLTYTGATATNIELLFPSDSFRSLTTFETIILPRGASMLLTLTPPTGNTSLDLAAGVNLFLGVSLT